jgi:hypothetical protein
MWLQRYVNRPIVAPPPLWLQKRTDLRAQEFANSPDLWSQARLADVTCAWSWRLRGISPRIPHILNNYIKHNPTEKLVVVQRLKNFPFHCIEPQHFAITFTIFRHCPTPTLAGQTQSTIFLRISERLWYTVIDAWVSRLVFSLQVFGREILYSYFPKCQKHSLAVHSSTNITDQRMLKETDYIAVCGHRLPSGR